MILQNWWLTKLLGTKSTLCEPLMDNISCDALVIGGGVAGLHAAQELSERGKDVVLLEKDMCGGSSSGRSSGFLTPDSELELNQMIRRYGLKGAQITWNMATTGVDLMVRNIKKYTMDCDVQKQDSLFLGIGKKGQHAVEEEAKAREALGYDYELYHKDDLQSIHPSSTYSAGVRYPNTYGIVSLLYTQELKRTLIKKGVRVFEGTEVTRLDGTKATTHGGSVNAQKVIVCIDKMKKDFNEYSKSMYHAQTFLCISEPLEKDDIKHIFPKDKMMCWDSQLIYNYYRLTGDQRLLLGGGSVLTTYFPTYVNTPIIVKKSIKEFKKRFPQLDHIKFVQYWPGLIDITKDIMPIVDVDPTNKNAVYVMGCPGLPWAAFGGNYAANIACGENESDYSRYLRARRKFFISAQMQAITGKTLSFAVNNAYAKYRQVDKTG